MRVLLVEDDRDLVDDLSARLVNMGIEILTEESRDGAITSMSANSFDLAILDLKIPSQSGALDGDVNHGLAVYENFRKDHQGTPLVIFSSYGTSDILIRLLEDAARCDLFGTRDTEPMIAHCTKDMLDDLLRRVDEFKTELESLRNIEIRVSELELSEEDARVLRIFSRRLDGKAVEVTPLDGGLSDSRVLRAVVRDASGAERAATVCKLADLSTVEDEHARFQLHVSPQLALGRYVTVQDVVSGGARRRGGIFYTLAMNDPRSLFQLLSEDPEEAARVVRAIRATVDPWVGERPSQVCSIKDLTSQLVSDESMSRLSTLAAELDLNRVGDREVQIRKCCQHGDLHGLNVLVDREGQPVLIDYDRVGDAPASLDPITLEMSLLFHPSAPRDLLGDWPSESQASAWANLDEYIRGCPAEGFVRECREWAQEVSGGSREVLVTAASHACRQLKFPDVNQAIVVAVLRSALKRLDLT